MYGRRTVEWEHLTLLTIMERLTTCRQPGLMGLMISILHAGDADGDVFGVDLEMASNFRESFTDMELDEFSDEFSAEYRIFNSDLVTYQLILDEQFGDSRYAIGGGELEADVARNTLLGDVDLFESDSRLQAVGIDIEIFFQVREFVAVDDPSLGLDADDSALAFASGIVFTVPENTSNSTFITLSNVTDSALFAFDPEFRWQRR